MRTKTFKVKDIFTIVNPKGHLNTKQLIPGDDIPYVAAKKTNNGVAKMCSRENIPAADIMDGNAIVFIQQGDGSAGYTTYQPNPFYAISCVTCGYSPRLNDKRGLYLVSILDKNKVFYSHARSWNRQLIQETELPLPVSTVPSPDYALIDSMIIGGGIAMSSIDTSSWRELKIGDVFEKIDTGKIDGKAGDFPTSPDAEHDIPLLTSSSQNQGLTRFAPRSACPTILSNAITVASNGAAGVTFYQEDEFAVLQDAYAIRPIGQNIPNRECGLFLASVIGARLRGNFDWSNKANWSKVRELKIKLPVIETEEIDWRYMDKRIAELEAERIAELEAYLTVTGLNDYELTEEDQKILATKLIDSSKQGGQSQSTTSGDGCWKEAREFRLDELFNSSNGDTDLQKKDVNGAGELLVSSGVSNNGYIGRTDRKAKVFPSNTITVDMFGYAFYRDTPYKMVTHARVFSLSPKIHFDKYIGQYIVSNMSQYHNIYNYNNMCSWNKIHDKPVLLPINDKSQIDYGFIESYIRAIEKLIIKDVVKYKDEIIDKTREILNCD